MIILSTPRALFTHLLLSSVSRCSFEDMISIPVFSSSSNIHLTSCMGRFIYSDRLMCILWLFQKWVRLKVSSVAENRYKKPASEPVALPISPSADSIFLSMFSGGKLINRVEIPRSEEHTSE